MDVVACFKTKKKQEKNIEMETFFVSRVRIVSVALVNMAALAGAGDGWYSTRYLYEA